MLKFRVSAETRHAATNINTFIAGKISGIGFLHKLYTKLTDFIYKIATQNPAQWLSMCVISYHPIYNIQMQIIDPFYLLTTTIIFVGVSVLLYM